MIRVKTIDELAPALRNRIKAKVMRRLIDHLRERPHVEDAALRRVFGFDRPGLDALYAALSRPIEAAGACAPGGYPEPGFDPEAAGDPWPDADLRPAPSRAPPAPASEVVRACCAGRARD